MSKDLKDIKNTVMNKIHDGEIKMRPRIYFIIGSILIFIGLVFSFLSSVFVISLMRFFLRSHGPMAGYRLDQLLTSFPWWGVVLAVLGLTIGISLLRRYDFSYKINFKITLITLIAVIIISGWIIDMSGLNDIWFNKGPIPKGVRRYFQGNIIRHDVRLNQN